MDLKTKKAIEFNVVLEYLRKEVTSIDSYKDFNRIYIHDLIMELDHLKREIKELESEGDSK